MMAPALLPVALLAARIAIVSSSTEAAGQPTLRYAERDAARMAAVLRDLGSFAPSDVWTLPRPTAAALRAALERAERQAEREPGSEIFFYYSGHADAEGLLLGSERLTYRELRERLERSRAQVRVAVLDACNSGGATQPKGGRPGTGDSFAAVVPVQVNGAVILAASRAEETAQESGELDGSVFTHHLISGLRGAGDKDGNGVVTLSEAYAHVYARTLAATVPSLWGAQHPSYDYHLSGTGDLVLTTLRRSHQGLVFAPGANAIYSVLDAGHEVVGEVRADPARPIRLALPPGHYRVTLRAPSGVSATDLTLTAAGDVAVAPAMLRRVDPQLALAKGGAAPPANGVFADYALVGRGLTTSGISAEFGVSYRRDFGRWLLGPRLSFGEATPDDVGVSYHLRRYAAAVYLLRRFTTGAVDVHLGGRVAVTYVEELGSTGVRASATVPGLAGTLALEVPLWRWLSLRAAWDLGAAVVPVDGSIELRPETRASFGLGARL
jgi:hypothetical protein